MLGGYQATVPTGTDLLSYGYRWSFYCPGTEKPTVYYGGPASLVNASCEEHENCRIDYKNFAVTFYPERNHNVGELLMTEYSSETIDHHNSHQCAFVGCKTVVLKKRN